MVTDREPGPRPRGRPRSAVIDQAVIDAALALLAEQGYEAMSIEGIAVRARVGRTAIYRRWPDKESLAAAALRTLGADVAVPDTGSVRADLSMLARTFVQLTNESSVGTVVGRLVGAALTSPLLMEIFYEGVVAPHRRAVRIAVNRGIVRGELRPDLDVELLIDQLVGPILYRLMFTGPGHVPEDLPDRILDSLLPGVAAPLGR